MSIQSSKEFFGELKEWSERKLTILEKYLDPFVKILGSNRVIKHVYYVDAFAGAGLYRNGEKGSSLRAAELAQNYKETAKPYQLKCINVEADRDNFENLQANTLDYKDSTLNFYGTFAENTDQILNEILDSPALFFLDPFGVKGMQWDLVHRILNRRHATDLWIRFDHVGVQRLNGRYGQEDSGAMKSFDHLCDVYGIYDKELLHALLVGNSAEERQQNAINLYTSRLGVELKRIRGKSFVFPYPIRSIDGTGKYHLIFATGHLRGAIVASELVCGAEESYQKELEEYKINQTGQLSLFSHFDPSEEEIFKNKVNLLAQTMWDKCKGTSLSRDQIYERILPQWFGKVRSTHVTNALRLLRKDGRIKHATGNPSDRKAIFSFRE